MSLAFKTKKGNKSDNNYYTPKYAWEDIEVFLPKDKLIYEAFKGDGQSAEYFRELGCSVVCEDVDFFDNKIEFDVIVTNPPYSFKPKIFSRLRELDKPFILLVPVSTITKKFYQDYFAQRCGVIIPKSVFTLSSMAFRRVAAGLMLFIFVTELKVLERNK